MIVSQEALGQLARLGYASLAEVPVGGQDEEWRASLAFVSEDNAAQEHMRIGGLLLHVLTFGGAPDRLWTKAAGLWLHHHQTLIRGLGLVPA